MDTQEIEFDGYRPGAVGDIVRLHATYYAAEWGFGSYFEAISAQGMGEILEHFKEDRDHLAFAYQNGRAVGSCLLDGREHPDAGQVGSGRLRFVIIDPDLGSRGIGRRLIESVVHWADEAGYEHLWLTTFDGLGAARHLYESVGFILTKAYPGSTYGKPLTEQRFDRFR